MVSEPSDLDVFLDGSEIGKTPVWSEEVKSGIHTLRVKHAETDIYVEPGKTLKVSLFKGTFISIAEEEKKVEKQAGPEKKKVSEARETVESPEAQQQKDLTPWERFISGH